MSDDTRLPATKELDESSALIVGGTAGIGLASARALAAAGVPRIVIVGRNAERGQLAAKSIAELGAATCAAPSSRRRTRTPASTGEAASTSATATGAGRRGAAP